MAPELLNYQLKLLYKIQLLFLSNFDKKYLVGRRQGVSIYFSNSSIFFDIDYFS